MDHQQQSQFTLDILREELSYNREVEFMLDDILYFIEPKPPYQNIQQFSVWEVSSHTRLFLGNLEDLLQYSFPGNRSLAGQFSSFEILYIY